MLYNEVQGKTERFVSDLLGARTKIQISHLYGVTKGTGSAASKRKFVSFSIPLESEKREPAGIKHVPELFEVRTKGTLVALSCAMNTQVRFSV